MCYGIKWIQLEWEMPEVLHKREESDGKLYIFFKQCKKFCFFEKNILFKLFEKYLQFGKFKIYVKFENLMTGESVSAWYKAAAVCGERTGLKIGLESRYSGRIRCQVEKVRIYDWSGLFFRTKTMSNGEKSDVLILPEITEMKDRDCLQWRQHLEGTSLVEDKQGYDYSEPPGIREYQEGDSMKSIHWKLTGRLDRLYVKEACVPAEHALTVYVETVHETLPDPALCDNIAAELLSVCTWLTERDYTYTVVWYHHEKEQFVRIRAGAAEDIRRILYRFMGCQQVQGELSGRERYEHTRMNSSENLHYISG